MGVVRWIRDAEFRPDAGCGRGMRDAAEEMRVEVDAGIRNEEGRDSREVAPFLISPRLVPLLACLFRTLHLCRYTSR